MAVLGKRKAPGSSAADEDIEDIFRRHFEARFAPLTEDDQTVKSQREQRRSRNGPDPESENNSPELFDSDEHSQDEESSEWCGLSSDEDEAARPSRPETEVSVVEVVDYSSAEIPNSNTMSKRELKAFMSSRPPDQTSSLIETTAPTSKSTKTVLPEDAPSLLAQDLELRRLLAESHLLSPANRNATSPFSVSAAILNSSSVRPKAFSSGRTRQKATDLRVQALGSKSSIHKQEKMPMNMRKGMVAAADARELKRRREARENGVILERSAAPNKKKMRKRTGERAVDTPGMGRLKGAELKLNKNDVRKIESSHDVFGRRSRR